MGITSKINIMKGQHIIYSFLAASLLAACSNHNSFNNPSLSDCPQVATWQLAGNDSVVVCNLSLIKDTLDIPLSQLVENFQIIKLDPKDEALVKSYFTHVTDNYIGVYSGNTIPYKLFDKEGNFLCPIGNIGQGPNEYNNLYYDQIDEKNNRIYLLPWNARNLLVYDLEGNYLPPIPLPYPAPKGVFHVDTEKEIVTVGILAFTGARSIVWQQDFQGNLIQEIDASPFAMPGDYSNEVYSTQNTDAFDFYLLRWATMNDTLYHYSATQNRLIPKFTVQFNGENIPIHSFGELPDYYMADMITEVINGQAMPPINLIIDKKSLKGTYFNLINDFLGNAIISFPTTMRFRNRRFYMNMDPGDLQDQLDKALSESDEYPDDLIRELTELRNSISPDDNNYLFTGKLKTGHEGLSLMEPSLSKTKQERLQSVNKPVVPATDADSIWSMPYHTADIPGWLSYNRKNNKYKDWDKTDGKAVLLKILVEKDGTPSDIRIIGGGNSDLTNKSKTGCGIKELDEEALRLVREAQFTPGTDKEKNPVRSYTAVFVYFPPK